MKVRDLTLKKSEYKGRWTDASDEMCPCRLCYNAHDCGRLDTMGKWHQDMQCASRYNSGCSRPKPKAQHVFSPRGKTCKRCGVLRKLVEAPR